MLPHEVHVTADFAYFRWQGKGENIWFDYRYSKEELEPWVPKVQDTASKVKKVMAISITTIMFIHLRIVSNILKDLDYYLKWRRKQRQRMPLNNLS